MTAVDMAEAAIRQFPFDNYGLDEVDVLLHDSPDAQEWVSDLAGCVVTALQDLGFRDARVLERAGSPLCDCEPHVNPPTSPATGALLDHHCGCTAVAVAAALLGAYSRTEHAAQCAHGTELDHLYEEML
ncbi:hypothetical protein [Micromonospora sp. NPDC047730]|uniref:hypothetical protein n=1 Tax=Micromonospora sp. NPDC047730 TaxID=3364253 RepID=UPI0037238484